ncbi:D-2-hydroxyacid dehydrogenase [bacterium]|nr:D-2-hydroxyacid dehydrogenase [bacterium]
MKAKSNPNILVYYHKEKYVDWYKELLERARKDLTILACKEKNQIEKNIEKADILFSGHRFPMELLPRAKNLKWIQSMSAGVENFIRSKLIPSNVILTKPKGIFGSLMAEYVIGYILAILKNMKKTFENQANKLWEPLEVDGLQHKTVGIMGLGSVGAHIAYRLHLLGLEVIGLDEQERNLPYLAKEYPVEGMDNFLGKSDFVVLTVPLTESTEGIIGEKQFMSMKESAHLINISRGPLVQEKALIKSLQKGMIAGAVLDVFNEEPLPKDHPLWNFKNVIITPHISGPSLPEDLAKIFLENLKRWEEGKKLEGMVDIHKGY